MFLKLIDAQQSTWIKKYVALTAVCSVLCFATPSRSATELSKERLSPGGVALVDVGKSTQPSSCQLQRSACLSGGAGGESMERGGWALRWQRNRDARNCRSKTLVQRTLGYLLKSKRSNMRNSA
jgi:hypothetical protein